jgi:predicted oxidoreductase
VSFDPPGGYGTMIVTGFDGNFAGCCAWAGRSARRKTAKIGT